MRTHAHAHTQAVGGWWDLILLTSYTAHILSTWVGTQRYWRDMKGTTLKIKQGRAIEPLYQPTAETIENWENFFKTSQKRQGSKHLRNSK